MAIRKSVLKGQIRNLTELRRMASFEDVTFQHPTQVLQSETLDAVFTLELMDATAKQRLVMMRVIDNIITNLNVEAER